MTFNDDATELDLVYEDLWRAKARIEALENEVDRLRGTLELIAGAASDKLQVLQAKAALANIGPVSEEQDK
jgi:hypothetical protein